MFTMRRVAWAANAYQAMAKYRYWRITWTAAAAGNDGFLECREIELRSSIGGADLTTLSTPITNSGAIWVALGSTPSLLIDNTLNPMAYSAYTANSWTTFDLGSPQAVAEFAYNAGPTPGRRPAGLSISGSNDGSSFTLLKAYTGITGYTDSTYKTFATT